MLMRIKQAVICNSDGALGDDKRTSALLEKLVATIHQEHGGIVDGNLPLAAHVLMLYQVYMVNSTYCERVFSLAERLRCKLSGGGGVAEDELPGLFKPYLLAKEIGIPLADAMQTNGMLEAVARKLLRKERRAGKAHLREIHKSKRGEFLGKVRLRCQRKDKGHVRGPQKNLRPPRPAAIRTRS